MTTPQTMRSQSFIHQVRILSQGKSSPLQVREMMSQSFIHQVRILSGNMVEFKVSYFAESQSFIHQVRILSQTCLQQPRNGGCCVAILYSSSQNSLKTPSSPSQPSDGGVAILYSSSQNSLMCTLALHNVCLRLFQVAILYSSSQNSLFEGTPCVCFVDEKGKSQSFIHQVRILSAPPQPLALHGLKYSFPQTSVFQL